MNYSKKSYLKNKEKILAKQRDKTLQNRANRKCRICNSSCLDYSYKYYCSEECQKEGLKRIGREHKKKQMEWYHQYKKSLGGCTKCGYNKHTGCLDFHHPNNDKKFEASTLKNTSKEKALLELNKCVLLCKNCHYEHHLLNGFNRRKVSAYEDVKKITNGDVY